MADYTKGQRILRDKIRDKVYINGAAVMAVTYADALMEIPEVATAPAMYEALKDVDMLYAEYCGLKPEPLTESWELVQSIVRKAHQAIQVAEGKG